MAHVMRKQTFVVVIPKEGWAHGRAHPSFGGQVEVRTQMAPSIEGETPTFREYDL